MEDPHAELERMYVVEYLTDRGLALDSVQQLPAELSRQVMIEAMAYASSRLAESETRAHLIQDLHGMTHGLHRHDVSR